MNAPLDEIRRQLDESCRLKQAFSAELLGRIAQFAERCAPATSWFFSAMGAARPTPSIWRRK
jgi:hypothetical protein